MKKILILASYPDSLSNFRASLISDLIAKGAEVHVAAPALHPSSTSFKYLESIGAFCHDVPISRTSLNPFFDIVSFYRIYKLISKIKPDTFLGYTVKPVVWGLRAANLADIEQRVALITGLGYAFTGRATGLRKIVQKILKYLYKSSLRKASVVIFQNPDDLEYFSFEGLLPATCFIRVVNGSGVDTNKFQQAPFLCTEEINFLLIARLLGDKGLREYISAARRISLKYPNAVFHLVGGLDTNPNRISEVEVTSWVEEGVVRWHGAVVDVRPFIADTHIFVLPSYREGTPRSVLEAMSMGRPIITTDTPGCRETVVDGENGFLVDVKSVGQLVTAMEQFIKTPELIAKMGKRSREMACEKYDVTKVNKEMINAMESSNK